VGLGVHTAQALEVQAVLLHRYTTGTPQAHHRHTHAQVQSASAAWKEGTGWGWGFTPLRRFKYRRYFCSGTPQAHQQQVRTRAKCMRVPESRPQTATSRQSLVETVLPQQHCTTHSAVQHSLLLQGSCCKTTLCM